MPIIVNGREAARAALGAASAPVSLLTPPYAACHAGVQYYRALLDELTRDFAPTAFTFTLCCGDDPAIAHDALRLGFSRIICACEAALFTELHALATAMGAVVMPRYPL